MSTLSTHILDISTGKPAEGVTVHLNRTGNAGHGRDQRPGAHRRVRSSLPAGRYRLVAEIGVV
jgi:5-hydroxyisourate hydrolase